MVDYHFPTSLTTCRFLEMLSILNEQLIQKASPGGIDHDCLVINGRARGLLPNTTTGQFWMRIFKGDNTIFYRTVSIAAFLMKCNLKVERSTFDPIIRAPSGSCRWSIGTARLWRLQQHQSFSVVPRQIPVLHIAGIN
jgi:succinate dehydrogenase / fumarate reductase, iron-sulfur subunit